MLNALEGLAGPVLRERGFVGHFPVFRRTKNGELHLLELQFSRYGSAFRLNLGVCPAEGITTKWGEFVPPDEVNTSYELQRKYYLDPRNITAGKSQEHWFSFCNENVEQVTASIVCGWLLTQGCAPMRR
jgi:hypothetical protein